MSATPRPSPEPPLTREGMAGLVPVSRETLDRLEAYLDLLRRWQQTTNLVGGSTLADPWRRHVLDSLQLALVWPAGARRLVDLGSGAGLPGLVLAIAGVAGETHLVESNNRKAAFLREAAAVAGATSVTVHPCRIEALPPLRPDVVTARALSPLPLLLDYAARVASPGTVCLFLKGRRAEAELTEARRSWKMRVDQRPSLSDADGRILIVSEFRRAGSSSD